MKAYSKSFLIFLFLISTFFTVEHAHGQDPLLNIQIISPTNSGLKNIENRIMFKFIVTHNGQEISGAKATLYINQKELWTDTSNDDGVLEFIIKLKSSDPANIRLEVEKEGYTKTTFNTVVSNFYKLNFSPDDGNILTYQDLHISIGVEVNGIGKKDSKVQLFFNNGFLQEKNTGTNGYAVFIIEDITYGQNNYYVKIDLDGNIINSDVFNFEFYRELITSTLTIDTSQIENFVNPTMILKTQSYSHNVPVQDVKVVFYMNGEKIGENYSDVTGICWYNFKMEHFTKFSWFVESSKKDYLSCTSITKEFDLQEYIPALSGSAIRPKENSIIEDFIDLIALEVRIFENDQYSVNAKVDFYVDNTLINSSFTDDNGLAICYFTLPEENHTFLWHFYVSKSIYEEYVSPQISFYYPTQPPDIIIEDTYVSKSHSGLNSEVIIGFQISWENGTYIKNKSVSLNGISSLSDDLGWVYFPRTNQLCELSSYNITKIFGIKYSNIIYKNKPSVIWDRVIFNLKPVNTRLSIGETCEYKLFAYYEYDKQNYTGEFTLNETPYSNISGSKIIKIQDINDDKFSLECFQTNEMEIIWDKIVFKNKTPIMYSFMNVSDLEIEVYYEYDKTKFCGTYFCQIFNKTENSSIVITEFNDDLYDLEVIDVKDMIVEYREFELKEEISTIRPGLNKINIKLSDEFTKKCDVFINGIKINYDEFNNEYGYEIEEYGIKSKINIIIFQDEKIIYENVISIVIYENLFSYFFTIIFFISIMYNLYSIQKTKINLF